MNRLKEYRVKAGPSQLQLSYKTHVAPTAISSIENNKLAVWPKAKKALTKALKCSQTELFPEKSEQVG